MTSPDGFVPEFNTGWGDLSDMAEEFVRDGLLGILFSGFENVVQAIFGTVNDDYVRQLPTITDHTQSITEIRAELEAATIFGNARVFTSNATYYATPGTIEALVIAIGAGGGGASGRWDLLPSQQWGGAGGGGGGETHFTIPGNLLFDSNGDSKAIPIVVGAAGVGAAATNSPGHGGGHTSISGVIAGGGNGGAAATFNGGGAGGIGVIRGGDGGSATDGDYGPSTRGGDSIASFGELYGGGGGGGAGASGWVGESPWRPGGAGGVAPGGQSSGASGSEPADIVATGGGGGAGRAGFSAGSAGSGAYPGGGGGGGGCGSNSGNWSAGGSGGDGIVFVIERAA